MFLLQVILYRFYGILFTSISLKIEINVSARQGLRLVSLSLLFALGTPVVMGNLSVVFGGFKYEGEKRKCLCDLDSFKWEGGCFSSMKVQRRIKIA